MNKMLITSAGLAEIRNAEQSGTAPVVLSHVAFGTGQYTATADMTKLKSEFKRFDSVAGGAIADNIIHLTVHDNSDDAYTVSEIGVFTDSGTLFAVYSATTPIMDKSAASETMLAIDIALTDIDPDSISIGDTNIVLNPATTTTAGIVELATDAEAKSGTDTTRAITPAAAKAARDADANIVHRSGNENIAGNKTFTGNLIVSKDSPFVLISQNDIVKGTTPSASQYMGVAFTDSEGHTNANRLGLIETKYMADGGVCLAMSAYKPEKGSTASAVIELIYPLSGNPYATAPTPAAGDNSTKIATTAFVNTKAANFLPLAGGTMSGNISFTDGQVIAPTASAAYRGIGLYADNGVWEGNGAGLALRSKNAENNAAGIFQLRAGNGTDTAVLLGKPDGSITWQNKNIVRSVNGTTADAAGNVSITSVASATSATKATQDGNGKVIADTYLAKSGGTITGNIVMSGQNGYAFGNGAKIRNSGNNNANLTMFLKDGDWKQSYIGLASGEFAIYAGDGTNVAYLIGKTDGTLTWNGKNIALDANVLHKTGNETITGAITTKSQVFFENTSSSEHRGFLYKPSDDAFSMGLSKSDNSGWQSYQSFFTSGLYQMTVSDGTNTKRLNARPDGTLTWDSKYVLNNSYVAPNDTGAIVLNAGTAATKGAFFRLYGSSHSSGAGQFNIGASNGTTSVAMVGKADGTLTWDGNKVVVLVEEQKATSANNRTWYRKYSDGWVEQGGRLNITSSNRTITFPVPMANKDNYNLQATVTSAVRYACVEHDTDRTTTGFKVATADDSSTNNDGVVDWNVCGYAAS